MPRDLEKLTKEQHEHLAKTFDEVLTLLRHTTLVVGNGESLPWVERFLFCAGYIQEWMIDPLRDAARRLDWPNQEPYPATRYGSKNRRRLPPPWK